MPEQTCRHCGNVFTPRPGKPGYIDECYACLAPKPSRMAAPAPIRKPRRPQTPEACLRAVFAASANCIGSTHQFFV
jgi:hypothetical protein